MPQMDGYLAADILRGLIIVGFFIVVRFCRTGRAESELSMAGQLDEIRALPEVER